jgi:hypothetical protein
MFGRLRRLKKSCYLKKFVLHDIDLEMKQRSVNRRLVYSVGLSLNRLKVDNQLTFGFLNL